MVKKVIQFALDWIEKKEMVKLLKGMWFVSKFNKQNKIIETLPKKVWEREFLEGAKISYTRPKFIGTSEKDPDDFRHYSGFKKSGKRYSYIAKDVSLYGKIPIAVDRNKEILWEVFEPRKKISPEHIPTSSLYSGGGELPEKNFDKTAVLIDTRPRTNYFHWMFDAISKIQVIEESNYSIGDFSYIFNGKLSKWQKSSLEAVGVPLKNCLEVAQYDFRVKRLAVISNPRSEQRYNSENINWLCHKIKSHFGVDEANEKNRNNIFVRRKKEDGRNIKNKDEIEKVTKKFNFESVYLRDKSFRDQVEMFSKANIILAAHGAGLTNLLFSENAKVVEVFFQDEKPMFYWMLSKYRDLEYRWMDAKVKPEHKYNHRPDGKLGAHKLENILRDLVV